MSNIAIKSHLFAALNVIDAVHKVQSTIDSMPECREKIVLEVECKHMMKTAQRYLDNSTDLYDKILDSVVSCCV